MSASHSAARPSNEDRIRAALWFAEHGFGVFSCWSTHANGTCRCPAGTDCTSPGKHPITINGFQDATRDEQRIRTFLSAASEPNYGLVCPDGVFAWDVDGEGVADLAAHEQKYGLLPPTLRTDTAHGQHVFLRWPDGLPRPLRKMFGFVTRWGSGRQAGYVIGPRSVHSTGAVYAPTGVAEIAQLPDNWARAVVEEEAHPPIVITGDELPQPGGRHDWLRDRARFYAGSIRDAGVLRAALLAENARLATPKTEAEVDRAIGEVLARFGPDATEVDPETGEIRRAPSEELGLLGPSGSDDFPGAPDPIAFGGLVGECVEQMAAGTDASLAGLLSSWLAVCGAMVPAMAYSRGTQSSSPFIALVGKSGIGRKGTAMNRAVDAARLTWQADNVNSILLDGLNSGEALVAALYERKTSPFNVGKPVIGLVFEEEYVVMLSSRARDGSTLDGKLRTAFDGGSLSNRKAAESKVVQAPYWLPAIAAITPRELRTRIGPDDIQTGSANRWLFVPVQQRPIIAPDEPPIFEQEQAKALLAARGSGQSRELGVDASVSRRLSEYADFVISTSSGIAQDLVKRYATIAFRLALIHAAIERATRVEPIHLDRVLALTEYARRGIAWVFGQTIGNRDADLLLRHLQEEGTLGKHTITRGVIRDPIRQQDAVDELVRLGYAVVDVVPVKGGRHRTELRATGLGVAFVPFVHFVQGSANTTQETDGELGRKVPFERESAGRKVDESWTKGGRKVDESHWSRPCRDYTAHQDDHRRSAVGWYCRACDAEDPA